MKAEEEIARQKCKDGFFPGRRLRKTGVKPLDDVEISFCVEEWRRGSGKGSTSVKLGGDPIGGVEVTEEMEAAPGYEQLCALITQPITPDTELTRIEKDYRPENCENCASVCAPTKKK